MSQALAHTREGMLNTWYFVLHVSGFGPEGDDAALEQYLEGPEVQADLEGYAEFLATVTNPLVEAGRVRYASPGGMGATWWAERAECAE